MFYKINYLVEFNIQLVNSVILSFDDYYTKEIESAVSQWTLAEKFLHKLSKVLNSFKKPINFILSPNSSKKSSSSVKHPKKKLKRKVAKKKTLNWGFVNPNWNVLSRNLMEIEIELECKNQNNDEAHHAKPFVPFASNEFKKRPEKPTLQIGEKLIPMSKIKKIRKISNNSQNPEPETDLVNIEVNTKIDVSLPKRDRRNS